MQSWTWSRQKKYCRQLVPHSLESIVKECKNLLRYKPYMIMIDCFPWACKGVLSYKTIHCVIYTKSNM